MQIWEILATSGATGTVIAICFIVYIITKNKKDAANKNKNISSNNINITSNKDKDALQIIASDIKANREDIKQISKQMNEIANNLTRLSIAMNYYVDNNGVSKETKKNFKNILYGNKIKEEE